MSSPAGKRDQLFMAVLRQAGDPVRVADVVSALDMNRFAASKLQALAGRRTQERTSAVTPIQQFGWLRRRHVFTAGRHSSVGRAAYSKTGQVNLFTKACWPMLREADVPNLPDGNERRWRRDFVRRGPTADQRFESLWNNRYRNAAASKESHAGIRVRANQPLAVAAPVAVANSQPAKAAPLTGVGSAVRVPA